MSCRFSVSCIRPRSSPERDFQGVAAALERFGQLDILVQSAGTTVFVPHANLDALSAADWQQIMAVNVIAPFQVARAARSALEASGSGEIVMISSVAGINGTGSSIPYCASKAALESFDAIASVLEHALETIAGPFDHDQHTPGIAS